MIERISTVPVSPKPQIDGGASSPEAEVSSVLPPETRVCRATALEGMTLIHQLRRSNHSDRLSRRAQLATASGGTLG